MVVTHIIAADVALLELVEMDAIRRRLNHIAENQVHPCITLDKMAVY